MNAALETREAELEVMRKVDVTLSYTEAEAAVILSHNLGRGRVMRSPWVVESKGRQAGFGPRRDIAFLGNFGHPPNLDAVMFFIDEVMPGLRSALPGVRFMVYGTEMPDALRRKAAVDVVLAGYVADVAEVYDACRVFVAPLRSGAGLKGKVIGALAAGVPVVLSAVAAEGTGMAHGREAFVAENAAEWVEGIGALYSDEARWTAMSDSAVALARSQYTFEAGRRKRRAALAAEARAASALATRARAGARPTRRASNMR
jgi:glycosyltransferase involved in cell wall biosynthesis